MFTAPVQPKDDEFAGLYVCTPESYAITTFVFPELLVHVTALLPLVVQSPDNSALVTVWVLPANLAIPAPGVTALTMLDHKTLVSVNVATPAATVTPTASRVVGVDPKSATVELIVLAFASNFANREGLTVPVDIWISVPLP